MRAVFLFVAVLFFVGCSDKVNVVVLPEEGGKVGMVEFVSSDGQKYALTKAWDTMAIDKSKVAVKKSSDENNVIQKYGDVISAMPPKPKSYMIFFTPESAVISVESKKELYSALSRIKESNATQIICAGHTDSIGGKGYNAELSFRRAKIVSEYLIKHGVKSDILEVRHYGEADPLVKTAPGMWHPRNRRVEIIVR